MTKNEFKKAAFETGKIFWVKYSGHIQTFFVCCKDSHAGVYLQELALNAKSKFKVVIG
jgi:hypothetical protein